MKRFVLVSLFALSSVALADVDVETAPAIKARSTLAPAGEVETYRFDAATGTKLSFSLVQASKKTPLVFSPSLDFGEQQISLNGFTLTSNGFAVKNIVLPHSGEYQLRVSATGTGDYSLTLATTPQTKWSGTLTLGAGATKTFAFSAPPGSSVALSAKPAKGSGATPTFGTLSGGGFETSLSGAKASAQNLTGTGDYLVQVTNGGAAGDVTVAVLVKTPKVKQTKLDLRGARFGKPQGGESVVTRTVGAAGGFVAVSDPASDLDGASVSIPEGALATTLPISVVSSTTPRIPTPGVQAAGPAVDLEPSGTTFGLPVTVTLPFDFSRLPPDRTSADIRVLVVEKDGSTSTLTPISTDDKNGTVTVQASGFSVCVPTAPQGMPRLGAAARGGLKPGGDEYWALFLSYEMDDSGPGNDSRSRQFHLDVGDGSFFGDGTFQVSTQERQVTLDDPNDGSGGVTGTVQSGTQSNSATGTFTYAADGQSIQLAPGGGDVPVLRVSKSGEAMVGTSRGSNNRRAEMDFLLRKNTATLSVASLSGTWNLGGVEFDGHGNMGPADLKMKHLSGTFAFDGKGGVRIAVSDRKSQFDTGAGTWSSQLKSESPPSSTYAVDVDGTVLVTIPPEKAGDTGAVLRLYPGPNADSFIGTDRDPQDGSIFAILLVKQSSGLSLKSLDGQYLSHGIEADTQTYSAGTSAVTVGDFEFRDESVSVTFDGTSPRTFTAQAHVVSRDGSVAGGVSVTDESPSTFSGAVTLSSTGAYRVSTSQGSVMGAVSPDLEFGFFVSDINDTRGGHLFEPFVKPPPAK